MVCQEEWVSLVSAAVSSFETLQQKTSFTVVCRITCGFILSVAWCVRARLLKFCVCEHVSDCSHMSRQFLLLLLRAGCSEASLNCWLCLHQCVGLHICTLVGNVRVDGGCVHEMSM